MGNSPKLEKSGKRAADASSSDIPLVAWKDASRTMPVNTTEPDCVRSNRAKACAHTSSQPDSDDFVDDGHRLRVAKNTHTCDVKGKKLFYVDNVILSMRSIDRSFPLFVSLTNESLKAREHDEIEAGGFGKGFVEADTHVVVGRHKSDKDGATANNNEIKSTMEPSVQAYVGQSEHAVGEEIGLHDKGRVTTDEITVHKDTA
ncbi:hypothetical protein STAS_05113 [Striga asiatica]|uniref:Uncharacterized protein n=1 Tax=Striga asiatica TaxID=4170 RepID=A0A5A7P916_STRAF|nr:hypothetical protein STAS_05113 [Striga asiatica]